MRRPDPLGPGPGRVRRRRAVRVGRRCGRRGDGRGCRRRAVGACRGGGDERRGGGGAAQHGQQQGADEHGCDTPHRPRPAPQVRTPRAAGDVGGAGRDVEDEHQPQQPPAARQRVEQDAARHRCHQHGADLARARQMVRQRPADPVDQGARRPGRERGQQPGGEQSARRPSQQPRHTRERRAPGRRQHQLPAAAARPLP
ncbi:hypothetical protein [Amycolatopsis albidoflavus]|uniref:hypothetical protein n=1 Tax=Amycolatopsis albidoflavus TaxID=102226 RepID=UPI0031D64C5E